MVSTVGGPLALVRTGDRIRLDVPARSLTVDVSDDELTRRTGAWSPTQRPEDRSGYRWLYREHVLQADAGADLDFLTGSRGAAVPRDSH